MSTNTLTPVDDFDAFDAASNPVLPKYELWGMVEISAWNCALVTGVGKVPFDANDPAHKQRFTAIDMFIQPLAELNITNPKQCECHMLGESTEWAKTTLASIKALGINNVREMNGKWARIEKVDGKPYWDKGADKKTTEPKGYEKNFKFVAFFDDEEKCRAAYLSNGGNASAPVPNAPAPTSPAPVVDAVAQERITALPFLNVIVPNASKGKKTLDEAKPAVTAMIAQYPIVSKYFTVDSPEVIDLIMKNIG